MDDKTLIEDCCKALCAYCRAGVPAERGSGLSIPSSGTFSYIPWQHRLVAASDQSIDFIKECDASIIRARAYGYFQWQAEFEKMMGLDRK